MVWQTLCATNQLSLNKTTYYKFDGVIVRLIKKTELVWRQVVTTNRFGLKNAHLFGHLCLMSLCIRNAHAQHFFASGQIVEAVSAVKLSNQPTEIALIAKYQFEQVIPIVFGLMLLVLILFILDQQLKKRVLQKFLAEDQTPKNQADALGHTNNLFLILGVLILVLSTALYHFILAPRLLYQDQIFVKYISEGLIVLALVGGYLFGGFKRSQQVELLMNDSQLLIEKKQIAQEKLIRSEQRLQRQNASLGLLAAMQLRHWQNPAEIFKEIAKISAETLNVERVGVWLFSEDGTRLECVDLYLKSKKLHTSVNSLQAQDFPMYFSHLTRQRIVAANDVMQHPATAEFRRGYAQANSIGAILDGAIWLNNHVIGVICHEHVGDARDWTLDEQNFAGSVADLTRLTIEMDRRRIAEQALLKQNEDLEEIVEARTLSLQESEKTFRYVVEHAPIPILIINKNAKITEFNPEAEIATGYSRKEALGKNFIEFLVSKESRKKAFQMSLNTLKGTDFRGVELSLRRQDGSKVEFECSASLAGFDLSTSARQIVAIGRDISQQKALEQSLIAARESAESADRIKSMFVASMSHELRTPLNSIIGFLGVVLHGMSGDLNAKQKDQLSRAYYSSKHLLSLITDVIDISKIEAGFLQVHVEKFELSTLFTEIQHAVHHLAEEKGLNLTIECPKNIKLETDRKRLYQVVLNVVSNGLKYTEKGSVRVAASKKGQSVAIVVEDTGIGIKEADLDNLFKPFERIDSHLKIKTLGTGLGLYLTRKILDQLLGGDISLTSQPGQGSVFTIHIPIKMSEVFLQNKGSILEVNKP
jgi:PAS domain S-box-containing protein